MTRKSYMVITYQLFLSTSIAQSAIPTVSIKQSINKLITAILS